MTNKPVAHPYVSLIIPAFDEGRQITASLDAICRFLRARPYSSEVIVVDDGSTDDTPSRVQAFAPRSSAVRLLRHPTNLGKGAAVRTGMLKAAGEYLIFTDADLSYALEDIETMLSKLRGGADVAIGSRALLTSHTVTRPPIIRSVLSKAFSELVQLISIRGIADTQCGFKGFARKASRDIFSRLTVTGFAFDVEVLVIARSLGYKIDLVPVHYIARETSKVRILRDSFRMLGQLLRIRTNEWAGLYAQTRLPRQAQDDGQIT